MRVKLCVSAQLLCAHSCLCSASGVGLLQLQISAAPMGVLALIKALLDWPVGLDGKQVLNLRPLKDL
ncbi:hypothetical protein ATANTOWER_009080 [Ataeniobius toweri]|uniref:Uncharacterized protein n=1 Tax=Ataeniobius toweri TaxID=208326 RepID=A0ABU7A0G8_9TELE|nr:hypothetical protein [Ataeniobius toweri]